MKSIASVKRNKKITQPVWTEDKAYDLEFAKEILREMMVIYASHIRLIEFSDANQGYWSDLEVTKKLSEKIAFLKKEKKALKWHEEKKIKYIFRVYEKKVIKYHHLIKDISKLLKEKTC